MPSKPVLPVYLLPLLLAACATQPHDEAVRVAASELGWKRSSIAVTDYNPFAPGQPAPADAPCRFYLLNATDRVDGGVLAFAEDAQGRLVGTGADADAGHAGLARVLQACLAHTNDAHAWANVVASYISSGWLGVVGENDTLAQQAVHSAGHVWQAPVLRQTDTEKTLAFWAQHGFSKRIVHVRATLGQGGQIQVEASPDHAKPLE